MGEVDEAALRLEQCGVAEVNTRKTAKGEGVEIFKGRVYKDRMLPMMDKIKACLQGWKGKLLLMTGQVELSKFVVAGMLLQNFIVYWWLEMVIKTVQKWTWNYIMTGEIELTKKFMVKRANVYKPKKEGGLEICRLEEVNGAHLCKLVWQVKHGDTTVSRFLKARFVIVIAQ
ncbi:uncharacterized protein LOC122073211 [Macadamia integrifolia]|uniref:uncharacterized protein LOC122073211 n=1 Tax=Macadamia integrifolia TaxID=60698 RepID=UPI001C500E0D|nr:uncharacterized protein LOC122073211 [Macadamia integrifolia]